jgi:antitoxin HicB
MKRIDKYDYVARVVRLPQEDGGEFEAVVPQLGRGAVGYGATPDAAVADLYDVLDTFFAALAEAGRPIPKADPTPTWREFSGKFNVRVPKLVHAQLVAAAEEEGVSLNALVQTLLGAGLVALRRGELAGVNEEQQSAPRRARSA